MATKNDIRASGSVFFSLIIPTLNEEICLPLLLADLADQTAQNFEVLIVDGGSADKTEENAALFKNKLKLRYTTSPKRNVSFQRNYGAYQASSEYLLFFDADVRIQNTFFEKLEKSMKQTKAQIFIPQYCPQETFFLSSFIYYILNMTVRLSYLTPKPAALGCAMIFEKKCFMTLSGFDEELYLCEDHEIMSRAKKKGMKIVFMPSIFVAVSARRFKRENKIKLMAKYTYATLLYIVFGRITKKIFKYKMGGTS